MKLLFLVAMTVFAQQSSLEAVYRMMQAGDWKNADRELTTRLAADPRNATALTARAYLFAQLGDHQQAIAFARQALAQAPKDEHTRNLLALSLMSTGQRDAGIQELQFVLRANPNNAAAFRNLGLAYLQAGFPEKAAPLLEKRLQLEPRDQFMRIDLIGTYYQLGNPNRAAGLMAVVPNDPDPLEKLCRTLNERDQYGESIKRLESFSRHTPLDPALRLVLAEAYTGVGTTARAAELLASIPASQRNAGYALTQAWTSSVRDDLPAAIQTLQQAIQAEPEDARLYHALSMLLLRGRAAEDAIDAAEHGLARQPDSPMLLLSLGMAQEYLERHEDAQRTLRRCIEQDQANGLAHYVLALSYMISGQEWTETEKEFQSALRTRPKDPLIASNYARELLKRRQYAEARKMAGIAGHSPEYAGAADAILGHISLAENKFEEAEQFIQSAIQKDPGEYAEAYRLGLAYMKSGEKDKAREYLNTFNTLKDAAKERDKQRAILMRVARF